MLEKRYSEIGVYCRFISLRKNDVFYAVGATLVVARYCGLGAGQPQGLPLPLK